MVTAAGTRTGVEKKNATITSKTSVIDIAGRILPAMFFIGTRLIALALENSRPLFLLNATSEGVYCVG
ncbi:MAG: hypothetical protein A4E53_01613 [Pelotomaculum sp. PtaB.Bin104]|nr:MAG: hypothetical protein A4E53_01613 [Pelotomaculum sp. PtaB.Bin104]